MKRRSTPRQVLVLTDQVMFGEGLGVALAGPDQAVRTGTVSEYRTDGAPAAPGPRLHFDAALVDADVRGEREPTDVVAALARAGTSVAVVTSRPRSTWGAYVQAGALRVLSKRLALTDVAAAIGRLSTQPTEDDVAERHLVLQEWSAARATKLETCGRLSTLTRDEREVLDELVRGRPVAHVAQSLATSRTAVDVQLEGILTKLDVTSPLAAVTVAHHCRCRRP